MNPVLVFEKYSFEIVTTSLKSKWVKEYVHVKRVHMFRPCLHSIRLFSIMISYSLAQLDIVYISLHTAGILKS